MHRYFSGGQTFLYIQGGSKGSAHCQAGFTGAQLPQEQISQERDRTQEMGREEDGAIHLLHGRGRCNEGARTRPDEE